MSAPIVGGFAAAAAAAISAGSHLVDMSKRTGLSIESLGELKYAAEQSGASMESLQSGVVRMQPNIGGAEIGTNKFASTLADLGLSLAEFKGLSADQQFPMLAGAISSIEDPATRAALATKVFGKSAGVELAPLLQLGEEGMAKLRTEAQDLGLVMSEESAVAADDLGDAFDRAKQQLFRMAQEIGVAIAGPLTDFLEWSKEYAGEAIRWIQNNKEIILTIGEVSLGVLGLSAAQKSSAAKSWWDSPTS